MSEVLEELNSYNNIKRISDEELEVLWQEYLGDRENKNLRDKLIVQYLYLTRYVVNRIKTGIPTDFSLEDIISFGVEGLIGAIEKFTPLKGARFETYALTRIRGNIIDKIRAQDFLPRNVRKKIREIKNIAEQLKQELGRVPTPTEIGRILGITGEKVCEILAEDTPISSIYESQGNGDSSIAIIDTIIDEKHKLPLEMLEEKNIKKELQMALNQLPEREKMVMVLYYHENMTLKEIGDTINLSESRACQIHSRAIMKLRAFLSEHRAERLQQAIV